MTKIIINLENEIHEYQADYVSDTGTFLEVIRKDNPTEKSYTEGSLWWKKTRTYTEYTHTPIAMFRSKLVVRVEL